MIAPASDWRISVYVPDVPLVFIADEFEQFGIREQVQMKGERPCVRLDIIDRKRHVQMTHVTPLVPFGNAKGFRCGMAAASSHAFPLKPVVSTTS